MPFLDKYTTNEKIIADTLLKEEEKTGEDKKTILSTDAFALREVIADLINKIEHTRLSLIR